MAPTAQQRAHGSLQLCRGALAQYPDTRRCGKLPLLDVHRMVYVPRHWLHLRISAVTGSTWRMCLVGGRTATVPWRSWLPIRPHENDKGPMRRVRFPAGSNSVCVSCNMMVAKWECTYRTDVGVLDPAAHEMPHQSLEANHLIGRAQRVAEWLV